MMTVLCPLKIERGTKRSARTDAAVALCCLFGSPFETPRGACFVGECASCATTGSRIEVGMGSWVLGKGQEGKEAGGRICLADDDGYFLISKA